MQKDIRKIYTTKNVFKGNSKFLMMQTHSTQDLEISQLNGVWADTYGPTKNLKRAFKKCDNVIMIFSQAS